MPTATNERAAIRREKIRSALVDRSAPCHVFCKRCGVRVYTHGYVEQIGGHYVSVMLSTLDDLPPATLAAAPVRYMNGRDDDWFHAPNQTAHL